MAKENLEISDLVKKCKFLLLDIEGTTTSISFVKDKLFPYAEENVKGFLESQWENADVKEVVAELRELALEDQEKSVQGVVAIPTEDAAKEEQIEALVKNVKWQMSADRKSSALKNLQGLIWRQGYDTGDIKGHVYDDVLPALELWRSTEGQKIYIYSSGSVQAQKVLFKKSVVGDMLPLIDGHFDTAVGAKREAASYAAIVEKIGCKAEEILFLTDVVKEAEAARSSNVSAALVSREGNAPLPADVAFPVLHSFEQLTPTNKRKPDPQIEEVPAKVPKTDVQNDVKTTSDNEASSNGNSSAAHEAMETTMDKTEKCETMEVEETIDASAEAEIESCIEPEVAQETKPSEVADLTEKDVPMDETANDTPAETKVTNSSNEINVNIKKVAETAPTVDTFMDARSSETTDIKASVSIKADKPKPDAPKVAEAKKESYEVDKPKAKMVDAATLTDSIGSPKPAETTVEPIVKNPIPEIIIKAPADEPKVKETEEIKTVEATMEKPQEEMPVDPTPVETPLAEQTSDETPAVVPVPPVPDKPSAKSNNIVADAAYAQTEEVATLVTKSDEANIVESKPTSPKPVELMPVEPAVVITEDKKIDEDKIIEEVSVNGTVPLADTHDITGGTVVENLTNDRKVADTLTEIKPVVEEKKQEKSEIDSKKIETEATEEAKTVTAPAEPTDVLQEAALEENQSDVEIRDITDEQSDENDIIDDVVPIVEEPSNLEDIEELQNAGDVLEKECDEILSKVQDVTSLDYIPVKPLHTIAEEMETENIDSNDIVERILDTEMELSMKPEDIDLNTVQEITESKTNDDIIAHTEPAQQTVDAPKHEVTEEKMEVRDEVEMGDEKPNENVVEPLSNNTDAKEAIIEMVEEKMDAEVAESEKTESEESIKPDEKENNTEAPVEQPVKIDETVQTENVTEVPTQETKENNGTEQGAETKINGKANEDTIIKLNGNANKDDDLKSRLTAENGKEKVNGSNGDSAKGENSEGDKVQAGIPDIKVKSVATEEAHPPIEQPVEV